MSTQKIFTDLGIFETSNFSVANNTQTQIPWSTPISFSYDQRIDLIKNISNNILPLSPISIHETSTNAVYGILPAISVVSCKVFLQPETFALVYTYANNKFSLSEVNGKVFAFEVS